MKCVRPGRTPLYVHDIGFEVLWVTICINCGSVYCETTEAEMLVLSVALTF